MHSILANSTLEWIRGLGGTIQDVFGSFGTLGNIVLALIVFLLLKKVAGILRDLLQKALNKTSLDDKLAEKLGYKSDISKLITTVSYLILLIYAAVIALDIGNVQNASEPLLAMLDDLLGYVPKIIGAGILLYILLFVANIVKQLLANVLEVARVDERIGSATGTPVANSLVAAAYGFLILLFIPAILDVLSIEAISAPIKDIVTKITSAVPNVLLAGVLVTVGVLVGQIGQRVVSNLLKGTGVDTLPSKIGLSMPTEGKGALSSVVGYVVLVSLVVTLIGAAIDVLNIELLSGLSVGIVTGYYNILLAVIIAGTGIIGSKFAYNALQDKCDCLAKIARIVIIVVTSVVALKRAGIAPELTSLPYQVAIIAAGVAFGIGGAIAIGFGARESVAKWLANRESK